MCLILYDNCCNSMGSFNTWVSRMFGKVIEVSIYLLLKRSVQNFCCIFECVLKPFESAAKMFKKCSCKYNDYVVRFPFAAECTFILIDLKILPKNLSILLHYTLCDVYFCNKNHLIFYRNIIISQWSFRDFIYIFKTRLSPWNVLNRSSALTLELQWTGERKLLFYEEVEILLIFSEKALSNSLR